MKKRLLATMLALCMVLALAPGTARAEDIPTTGTCGENATWTYNVDTKVLTISGTGEMSDTGQRYHPWSAYQDSIEKVVIENGITSISNHAFMEHKNLVDVSIPNSVTKMGEGAFWMCEKLSNIVIPASVTEFTDSRIMYEGGFGQPVFSGCPLNTAGPIGSNCDIEFGWTDSIPAGAFLCCPIKSIILPEGLRSIGEAAFAYNKNLTDIVIPSTVTAIDKEAFFGCRALEQLSIPASVIRINEDVFENCNKLNNLSVAAENKIYSSQSGVLFNKEKSELIWCPKTVTSYTVPRSVTGIGNGAFRNCSNLASITLPDGLTSIGRDAFQNCTSLKNIVIPDSVTQMSDDFDGCTGLTEITLSGGIRYYGGYSISSSIKRNLNTIKISQGTTNLSGTFSGFSGLTTVYLPVSITEIGENTFKDCNNLKEIYYSGTQSQWDRIRIANGNQEISLATVVCTGTTPPIFDIEIPTNPNQLKALANELGLLQYANFDVLDDTPVTRLEVAELLASMPGIAVDASKTDLPFTDCGHLTDSQKAAVFAVVEKGLLSGYSNNSFGPDNIVTRAQVAALIHHFLGSPSTNYSLDFLNDVDIGMWYHDSVASLCEIGIIKTTSNYFYPNDYAERLSVVEWLCAANLYTTGNDMPNLPDIPDIPEQPETPAPGVIDMTIANGGLGKQLTVQVRSEHWLTVQTRRSGSISIMSIQAPNVGGGVASVTFSAPLGSTVQVWETEGELQFVNGVPINLILKTVVKQL